MAFSYTGPRIEPERVQEEYESLPYQEREQIQHDMFGTGEEAIMENPQFNRDAIQRLEGALEEILAKEAYELAQIMCPDYVNSDDFRLLFLRSERFDIQAAAEKLVLYWDRKVELFGPERAFRKISIEDLDNEEDVVALEKGGIRALPFTDSAGRALAMSYRAYWDLRKHHDSSMLRLAWYVAHEVLENVDAQRNGIVMLVANGLPAYANANYNAKLMRNLWKDRIVLPVRIQAIHVGIENEIAKLVLSTNLFASGPKMRARHCVHSAKHSELAEKLEPYGISEDVIPVEFGGTLDYNYESHLEVRRQMRINEG
jgi:hypothetical protein